MGGLFSSKGKDKKTESRVTEQDKAVLVNQLTQNKKNTMKMTAKYFQ